MVFKKILLSLTIFFIIFSFHSVSAQTPSQASDDEFVTTIHELFGIFHVYSPSSSKPSGSPQQTPAPSGTQPGTPAPTPKTTGNQSQPPTPTLKPSGGGSGITSIVDNALFLYNLIKTCPGASATTTNGCYDRIKNVDRLLKNGRATEEIRKSIFDVGLSKLQCVGFAKAIAALDGKAWDKSYGPAANYIASAPPSGYRKILKGQEPIQAGDYVFWGVGSKSPSGHVAVVVSVESDDNTFDVVEANVANRGEMNRGTRRINSSDYWSPLLKGWYRKI